MQKAYWNRWLEKHGLGLNNKEREKMQNTPINFYIIWPLPLLPSSPACSIYSRSLASIQFFNNPNIAPTPGSLHLLVPLPGSVVYLDVLCLDSPHPPGLCHLLEELHPPHHQQLPTTQGESASLPLSQAEFTDVRCLSSLLATVLLRNYLSPPPDK